MKWTTANIKSPDYTENHEIYVGTQTGTFKKLLPTHEENPFAQRNLQDLSVLSKGWNINSLSFGNANKTEILIGRGHNIVQLFSTINDTVEHAIELQSQPVVGLVRYNEQLVAGFASAKIQCALLEDGALSESKTLGIGDDMSHMRQCALQPNLIATGGKGRQNNLKVFDIAADDHKPIFSSKNVPPDFLQLEVPIWDSDVGFIDSPYILATCSRTGYVRVYDTRKQRRPVQCYSDEKQQMSFSTLVTHSNYIYTGSTMGHLKAFDIRKLKNFVHTYKGFTGAISDLCLDDSGKYLASSSLDRYVRVHNVDSTVLLYQCYVKSKATRLLLRKGSENLKISYEVLVSNIEKKITTKQNESNKNEISDDEEYEQMFEQMQTIKEKNEIAEENSSDQDDGEEEEEKEIMQTVKKVGNFNKTAAKRKPVKNELKNKKKKIQ